MIQALTQAALALGVLWTAVRPGIWQREIFLASRGPLSTVRAVAVRLDPAQFDFDLDRVTRDDGLRGGWTIDALPVTAVVAFNAGQFTGGHPWGWIVQDGVETQPPGAGVLPWRSSWTARAAPRSSPRMSSLRCVRAPGSRSSPTRHCSSGMATSPGSCRPRGGAGASSIVTRGWPKVPLGLVVTPKPDTSMREDRR